MASFDLCEDWDGLDPTERIEALAEALNADLVANGYDPVEVTIDAGAGSARTDPDTGNISVGADYIADAGRNDAIDTTFHEAWHAMDVQDGVIGELNDADMEEFNNLTSVDGYYDEDGELRVDYHYDVPDHDIAQTYGEHVAANYCDDGDDAAIPAQGAESSSDGFPEEIEWEMGDATITDSPSDTVEWEMGDPVVTDAPPDTDD
jgi:hypothetical protein